MLLRFKSAMVSQTAQLQLRAWSARAGQRSRRRLIKDLLFASRRLGTETVNREPFFAHGLFLVVFIFWLLVIGALSKYVFGCYR